MKLRLLLVPLLLALVAPPVILEAQSHPDFSGSYNLKEFNDLEGSKGQPRTLEIRQSDSTLEFEMTVNGNTSRNKIALNGTAGPYVSPNGVRGTCKAQWKGRALEVDTIMAARPGVGTQPIQVHTRQRWQLSSDSKTLTIRYDMDFPSLPAGMSVPGSFSEIYTRN